MYIGTCTRAYMYISTDCTGIHTLHSAVFWPVLDSTVLYIQYILYVLYSAAVLCSVVHCTYLQRCAVRTVPHVGKRRTTAPSDLAGAEIEECTCSRVVRAYVYVLHENMNPRSLAKRQEETTSYCELAGSKKSRAAHGTCATCRARQGERKESANSTRCSQAVTHPSTNRAQRCLTSVIGREPVCSTWYGRCRRGAAAVEEQNQPGPLPLVAEM